MPPLETGSLYDWTSPRSTSPKSSVSVRLLFLCTARSLPSCNRSVSSDSTPATPCSSHSSNSNSPSPIPSANPQSLSSASHSLSCNAPLLIHTPLLSTHTPSTNHCSKYSSLSASSQAALCTLSTHRFSSTPPADSQCNAPTFHAWMFPGLSVGILTW